MTLFTHTHTRVLALASVVAALAGCVDDEDDRKTSQLTLIDAATLTGGDAASPSPSPSPSGFDLRSATLQLSCKNTVVTETTLAGFTVTLRDALGRVPSAPLPWVTLAPSTGTVMSAERGGGYVDAEGKLEFAYTAPHFDFPTQITLEASVRDEGGLVVASERCSFAVATAGLAVVAPVENAVLVAGRATPVTLRVVAEDVAPSCATGGGVSARFVGKAGGGVARTESDPPGASVCFDLSELGRELSFWVRGGDTGGVGQLELQAGRYRTTLPLKLVGAPAMLTLTADKTDLDASGGANLTVRVFDDAAQPVPGARVQLAIGRCAAAPCDPLETISPAEVLTGSDGSAASAYFAGATAGAAQVKASVADRPTVFGQLVLRVR